PNGVAITPEMIFAGLMGAVLWNLFTWLLGLPSSSSHALFGGLIGAAIVGTWSLGAVNFMVVLSKVLLPAVLAPTIAGLVAYLCTKLAYGITRRSDPDSGDKRTQKRGGFRRGQIFSSSLVALAHGTNDAQKTMGIIALAIFGAQASGTLDNLPAWLAFLHPDGGEKDIDRWIIVTCALVMAAGTAAGGWRIIKTLGHKMVKLHPIDGFAAETASATILSTAAHFGMPVSTTHSISTAIMGVGFAKNPRALKLTVIERIVWAWILTIPAAGGIAYGLLRLFEALGWA
ncbi:MAG: inorganic phosphate transporter, partial [Luteimonas sp.]